jgi:hypothetical protein
LGLGLGLGSGAFVGGGLRRDAAEALVTLE